MIHQLLTKLEINTIDAGVDPASAAEFAQKHRCPSIVVLPIQLAQVVNHKIANRGNYQIIAAVDFPRGNNFSLDKLMKAGDDISSAEGYDIVLSTERSQIEIKNEVNAITSFLKQINPIVDLRWTLKLHTEDLGKSKEILAMLRSFPAKYIRIDPHLELPNVSIDDHIRLFSCVRENIGTPIKLSGNVNLEVIKHFAKEYPSTRFDVSPSEAVSIVRALEQESRDEESKSLEDVSASS